MKTISQIAIAAAILAFSAPVSASKTDSPIESSARQSYVFQVYLKGDDIKIESNDGEVILTGVVAKSFHQSLAQETVVGLPGVRSVINRLQVKEAPPAANSDAWLLDRVRTTLLFHRSMSAGIIEVKVKDGLVTLRGRAINQAQKELATGYVNDVEGVKDVKNEIAVPMGSKKPSRITYAKIDDASITAQVRMMLRYHGSTSALTTSVSTNNGVVTLGGKAGNTAEKALVSKLVGDVYGVKNVANLMTID
ncbi:MAG: transport-associated protein [Elusimicrobia bacterium RIFOXYA2_FULL_53_38]|nr:MAG: transport-associated protein [Elusimicrobia bacterium RIFOXYA2_FULL_53_38]